MACPRLLCDTFLEMGLFSLATVGFAALGAVLAAAPGSRPSQVVSAARTNAPTEERDAAAHAIAGFRMEGSPELEIVFGDIEHFKGRIDEFYRLHESMAETRARFQAATHRALTALSAQRRGCPIDELALPYRVAVETGESYRRLGTRFETTFSAIRALDRLGETAGLTPDYRWKVNRAAALYRRALSDFTEMRAAFADQLEREMTARRCRRDAVLARAAKLEPEPAAKPARTAAAAAPTDVIEAPTATFFVDNRRCSDAVSVYVDGTLLGQVAAGTKAAFQSLAGRHSMCLLGDGSDLRCGETGSLRTAFVHDGWALARHCD